MKKTWDGGPAFPQERTLECGSIEECEGLSMRDYFAAKAMQTLLAEGYYEGEVCNGVAIDAYEMADIMLWARNKK